jgi:type I restriction enzyme M protein
MLGAIIGDIAGSRFGNKRMKSKEFELFSSHCHFTDDTVMTLAVAKALIECNGNYEELDKITEYWMRRLGRQYPRAGYGYRFFTWILSGEHNPYGSFGNGSAMRVSSVGYVTKTIEEVKDLSYKVTYITHNHPEGLKGAEAVAVCVFLAKSGSSIEEIRNYVNENYYTLDFSLDDIRDEYEFDVTCQGSVPQAITAFLESEGFEDAIRNAIALGGDSDTLAAISGSISEAYYGIPKELADKAVTYMDDYLHGILIEFNDKFGFVE